MVSKKVDEFFLTNNFMVYIMLLSAVKKYENSKEGGREK